MRQILPAMALALTLVGLSPGAPLRAEPFQTSLRHVILMDAETRTVLF